MRALLVVAHGSRRDESNDEVRRLTDKIRELKSDSYDLVECAFLELAEPLIPDGIRECIQAGAEEVTVVPYFLSAGRHVSEDIPEIIESAQAEFPSTRLTLSPHLGTASALAEMMLKLAK